MGARLREVVLLDAEAVGVDGGQLVEGDADLQVARDDYAERQDVLEEEGDYGVGVLEGVGEPHLAADLATFS